MEFRVSLLKQRRVGKEGVEEPRWIELGIVDAETREDVFPFAEKEWGLTGTDEYKVSLIISQPHGVYLYDAVKELLEELEVAERDNNAMVYPETTAIRWMRHAVEKIERTPEGREEGVRRV